MKKPTLPEKPKVDVKAIMAKASKKIASVKNATEKVDALKDGWALVPGLTKYEFNGKILRNATTKRIMSPKVKNGKYQLISDDNKNVDRSKQDIIELMPKAEVKPKKEAAKKAPTAKKPVKEKTPKADREIKNHHVHSPMALDKINNPKARAIMGNETITSRAQIEALFYMGIDRPEIVEITGRRDDVVAKYIRHLKR